MMKNYVKEGQKLPLFGIGPYLIWGMLLLDAAALILAVYVLEWRSVDGMLRVVFPVVGVIMIAFGLLIWVVGAFGSGMIGSIANNTLKTDGIYAWVRNPMYSGLWILFSGVTLLWHNVLVIPMIFVNWLLMTVVLKRTEERWLLDLYGEQYAAYMRAVNRCVPWVPRRMARK